MNVLSQQTVKLNVIIMLFALTMLSAWSVQACQREIGGTTFTVTPVANTSTARAEAVNCQLGTLRYYDPNLGWLDMLDELGHPLGVHDVKGTETPWGIFLVAILQDYRVVMRYGPPSTEFFAKDQAHSAFYAVNQQNNPVYGFSIKDVFITPRGEVAVAIEAESDQVCSTQSDATGAFYWNWECKAALPPPPPVSAREIEGPIQNGYQRIGINESGNPEAGFIIYGAAAAAMYDMMRSQPQPDGCTGGQVKTDASGFNCLKQPSGEASCSFGYNFATQGLTAGPISC